jgi:type I restriction enzyme S subunit
MARIATPIQQSQSNHWPVSPLHEQADLRNGSAFKPEDWKSSGVPIVRIQNLKDRRAPFNYFQGDPNTRVSLKKGDLLFSWSGSIGTSFGPHYWWGDTAVLNQHIFRVDLKADSQVTKGFLYFALLHLTTGIESHAYGLAALVHVRKGDLEATQIPLPTLPEQRKIASTLGLVQRAIEQQERLIALTTELKKSLMHKLFTEGLRGEPQKQTEIGPVLESWDVKPLRDCCIVQTGIAKGRKVEPSEALTLPYLRVANVQAGHLDLSEMKAITIRTKEKERYLLRKGDVVLTEGGDFDKLGRGFIWDGQIKDCVHQNHIFAVRVDRLRLLPEFFAHLSQSPYGKAYFLSVAHKTTNLACINTTKLKGFPVLIPSLTEQEDIVQVVGAADTKLSHHIRKKEAFSSLFRTLLHQLMTAQIRVHDLDLPFLEQEAVAS